ncbi:MAG: hypothetical protein WCK70_17255 [Chloroflexales bacterium]
MQTLDPLHGAAIRMAFALTNGWRPYGRHTAALERSQWLPWPRIQEIQMRKLRGLLDHAARSVPFYRRRFADAGLRPKDIRTPADLARLPLLSKREIQDHLSDLLAKGSDRSQLIENHTGGSTGQPLTFYQDAPFVAWAQADKLRNYRMAGYRMGMRWAFLWGSDYDASDHKGWRGHLTDRIIYNMVWINTFDLTTSTLLKAARDLARFRPEMIVAYVSSATLLARLLRDQGGVDLRTRSIQTSAEVLTADDRALLAETFGCALFDRYGCREVGNIAHECDAHGGLHLLAENNLVELLDDADRPVPPGQIGRIVVTNLNNRAMPLIRYEIGDLAVASETACSCGRGLPLLKTIMGRSADVITSPSGRLLHGEFFTHLFYKIQGIYQFRVIQETHEDLRVQIVPAPGFDQSAALSFLERTIHDHGDPAFHLRFEICAHLPTAASGKYRFTVSQVPLSFRKEG